MVVFWQADESDEEEDDEEESDEEDLESPRGENPEVNYHGKIATESRLSPS